MYLLSLFTSIWGGGIWGSQTGDSSGCDTVKGTGVFAGATGVEIAIGSTLTGTNYAVLITPTEDALNVGAIDVRETDKTTTSFKVYNTGNAGDSFDWVLADNN